MVARRENTKQLLAGAIVRLVADGGAGAATIQAIAREVGVTEGAIYRHYRSKEELYWKAYAQIVEQMSGEKEQLANSLMPLPEKIREWVRLTYVYFDAHPQAFTYVLLTNHPEPGVEIDREITTRQGRLFRGVIERALDAGEARRMPSAVAVSHFTGLMLNVPRLINEGVLEGPAAGYVEEVADAIWAVLRPV